MQKGKQTLYILFSMMDINFLRKELKSWECCSGTDEYLRLWSKHETTCSAHFVRLTFNVAKVC